MRKLPPSPGLALLPFTSSCECGWQGIEHDRARAFVLWTEHARRAGHDQHTTSHAEVEL